MPHPCKGPEAQGEMSAGDTEVSSHFWSLEATRGGAADEGRKRNRGALDNCVGWREQVVLMFLEKVFLLVSLMCKMLVILMLLLCPLMWRGVVGVVLGQACSLHSYCMLFIREKFLLSTAFSKRRERAGDGREQLSPLMVSSMMGLSRTCSFKKCPLPHHPPSFQLQH